ncbi:hypothetical protein TNCV_2846681 [Trichonephila clavipes]|nr:hypothetical protein TNCV_2846681 [Trichonephila clavipes]
MSVKTIEKRRKRSWSLYLMLCKGTYKAWITSDKALFHLSFTIGKTKMQDAAKKRRKKLPAKSVTTTQLFYKRPVGRQMLWYGWECPLNA